jgi:hypothetical protein
MNANQFLEETIEGYRTLYKIAKEFNGKGFNIATNEHRIKSKYPKFRMLFNVDGDNYAVYNNVRIRISNNGKSIMFWDNKHDILNSLGNVVGTYIPSIKKNSYNPELSEIFDGFKDKIILDGMAVF